MTKRFRFSDMSEDRRLKHVSRQRLETEEVLIAHKGLDFIWRLAKTGDEGDGAFVFGETGAGKTTAVRMFTDDKFEEMRAEDPGGKWTRPEMPATDLRPIMQEVAGKPDYRPIAVMSVNPVPRYSTFMHDAAYALGVELEKNANFSEASKEVLNALKLQKVKMFIFDDVQHIVEAHMDDYKAADVFKTLLKSRVQVVCIGLPKSYLLSNVNPQLKRLIRVRRILSPMRCSLGDFPPLDARGNPISGRTPAKTQFAKLMETIDRNDGENSILPFDEPSNLSHPRMALRIHQATGGYVGEIMKLIRQAAALAIIDGRSKIAITDFAQAYEDKEGCDDGANWFKLDWSAFVDCFGLISAAAKKAAEEENEAARKVNRSLARRRRNEDAIAGRG
jgi:Bacterial TniB protein